MEMGKGFWRILLTGLLVSTLVVTGSVFAGDSNTEDPQDPGAGSGQDNSKTKTTQWVLPHGSTFVIDDVEYDIVLDWESIDITSSREPGNSDVIFIGIGGGEPDEGSYQDDTCGNGNGKGNCNQNQNCNGNGNCNGGGNGGGPLPQEDCGGVWITPGNISADAQQIAPGSVLVVGQDPDNNGVTLDWHVSINPTKVTYQKWEIIGHRKVACVEGESGGEQNRNGNGHDEDWPNGGEQNRYGCGHNDCDCPHGWHAVIEHIWGCAEKEKYYREGIADLSANTNLQLASRAWILDELAKAYPGAGLINPDWAFSTTPDCVWSGDVCNWNFSLTVPVADPGWYDLKVSGLTAGTKASPPRSFEVDAGEFGAYMIDSSEMTH